RADNTVPQIRRIGSCHRCWPPTPASILNQKIRPLGIPFGDSAKQDRALELSASALILVHNHPSGDPTPSKADIAVTRDIVTAAKPLGVTVHAHVIIGRGRHTSLRDMGLLS